MVNIHLNGNIVICVHDGEIVEEVELFAEQLDHKDVASLHDVVFNEKMRPVAQDADLEKILHREMFWL